MPEDPQNLNPKPSQEEALIVPMFAGLALAGMLSSDYLLREMNKKHGSDGAALAKTFAAAAFANGQAMFDQMKELGYVEVLEESR